MACGSPARAPSPRARAAAPNCAPCGCGSALRATAVPRARSSGVSVRRFRLTRSSRAASPRPSGSAAGPPSAAVPDTPPSSPARRPGPVEDIRPLRALDGAAGILRHHQPPHRIGAVLLQPDGRAQRHDGWVHRDAPPRGDGPVLWRPEAPWPAGRPRSRERTRRTGSSTAGRAPRRGCAAPGPDDIGGHLVRLVDPALDQLLPDRAVGATRSRRHTPAGPRARPASAVAPIPGSAEKKRTAPRGRTPSRSPGPDPRGCRSPRCPAASATAHRPVPAAPGRQDSGKISSGSSAALSSGSKYPVKRGSARPGSARA